LAVISTYFAHKYLSLYKNLLFHPDVIFPKSFKPEMEVTDEIK